MHGDLPSPNCHLAVSQIFLLIKRLKNILSPGRSVVQKDIPRVCRNLLCRYIPFISFSFSSFFASMTGQIFDIMTAMDFFRQCVSSPLWRILEFDSVTRPPVPCTPTDYSIPLPWRHGYSQKNTSNSKNKDVATPSLSPKNGIKVGRFLVFFKFWKEFFL